MSTTTLVLALTSLKKNWFCKYRYKHSVSNMIQSRYTYGAALKQAIMDNNDKFLENTVMSFNDKLYDAVYDACSNCDINALKDLIKIGADLSHPYFCQPECFILNPIVSGLNHEKVKTFLEYIIINCIDVNAVAREAFYCMHSNKYSYGNVNYVKNHTSFKSVPTLLDIIEIEIEFGKLDTYYCKFILELLKSNGAKSGTELGYTHIQGKRLLEYF